ncbi:alpha/beta fold hydrolase [Haloarchaeobius litoreus]|uniref:Alpha/beta fold hydrolase n=1 Tax=Haloarchaeobius litoreus TaxID=755306 RepID=A0ABD6DHH9_9EURY|nr:alpha/beta fold hydrolase [Haloarchaeobius litoreus]
MSDTTDPAATARTFATRFLDRSFADAADLLTDDGHDAVVDSFPEEFSDESMDAADAFEEYWWGLHGQYGEPEGVADLTVDDGDGRVALAFESGTEIARLAVTDEGIADLRFDPEYEPPAYADESAFEERTVTVDAGDVDLDGVLAVPEGEAPVPGVVLVHGAGVHDPDGTAENAKILKDLAWGLASEGIATLRYEKRLAEHEVPDEAYTLDRVVVDDAVAAVRTLGAAAEVDDESVFVSGHSQGGMAAPRIAERHGGVAGVVVLDGRADSVLDPDGLDFMRYEFDVDGDIDEEDRAEIEEVAAMYRRIADGEFDDDETIMGKPGVWHRSVGEYDPSGTASDLDVPTFALKTCGADHDSQPELAAFFHRGFEAWRDAPLPAGSRVERYEDVDHYFQHVSTPTGFLSLYFGGNVADEAVADLARWVHDTSPR